MFLRLRCFRRSQAHTHTNTRLINLNPYFAGKPDVSTRGAVLSTADEQLIDPGFWLFKFVARCSLTSISSREAHKHNTHMHTHTYTQSDTHTHTPVITCRGCCLHMFLQTSRLGLFFTAGVLALFPTSTPLRLATPKSPRQHLGPPGERHAAG